MTNVQVHLLASPFALIAGALAVSTDNLNVNVGIAIIGVSAAFSLQATHPEGYTVYLLTHEGENLDFLEAHPAFDDELRAF